MQNEIDQMAKIILDANCARKPCRECKYDPDEVGMCMRMLEAEALYNSGYRKASDVAREIFEAVDKLLWQHSRGDLADKYFYIAIDELKKKYTEGEV